MIGKLLSVKFTLQSFRVVSIILFLLLFSGFAFGQEKTIMGHITDKAGAALPGVNVVIKGSTIGVVTDLNGKFSLTVPSGATLVLTYIGYENQEVSVGEQTNLNIQLTESIAEIDQVIVVGYGVQKKSDLTGAIASVSSDKLAKTPITGLDQALQGMAAGVNIIPVTGRPGSGVNIQIRGIASINGTKPKIVVDGVAQDDDALSRINPSDVESIEVLKDASSAAIYGATGGNGVILVTTKKGKSGELKVNYNAYMGMDNVIKKLDLMNSQQWIELIEETNSPKTALFPNPGSYPTYDWQDIYFKEAISQNHDLSITGGSEKSSFLFSASYSKDEGIIKNTNHQRFTMRINSEHKVNKYITFEEKISYVNDVTEGFADWEYSGYYQNPVMAAYQMVPFQPAYDDSGKWTQPYGGGVNPLVAIDMKDNTMRKNNFEGNFSLNITPIKGLTYTSRFTQGLNFGDNKEYQAIYYASTTDRRDGNSLIQSMNRGLSWNLQNIVSYTNTLFGDHNLLLLAGHEASKYWGYDINGRRVEMPSDLDELMYLSMSLNDTLATQVIEGGGYEGRSFRYFGRLNYDYKGKYLLTVNVSRDYATNFGPMNRAGTFPSFSFGWKFTEEEFMKNLSFLNFGKIRFGWGSTGANAKTGYPYLTTVKTPNKYMYAVDGKTASIGAGPEQIANPSIKWESVNMTNYGLDLALFNNKLTLSAEYFIKVNDGMIMSQQVPFTAGAYDITLPEVNIGSIQNTGVEFTIGHKNKVGDLKYSMDLNVGVVRNKILSLATDSLLKGGVHVVSPITLTYEGGAVSEFYGYKINGFFTESDPTISTQLSPTRTKVTIINQPYSINSSGDTLYMQANAKPGDYRFTDTNGDGKLDNKDKVSLGSPLPKFTFGFTLNLEYKMFDLNAFFNGSYGNKVFNGSNQYLYYSQGYGNRLAAFDNRYKDEVVKEGVVVVQANKTIGIARNASDNYNRPSDFYVEDGSYIRLRSIQLGVTLPASITKKVGISRFRMYVGGKNLITLTNYSGVDPVVSGGSTNNEGTGTMAQGIDIGGYPTTKTYLAGINLEF